MELKLNAAQEIVQNKLEAKRKEGKPVRFVILKARQEGISTWTSGVFFHDTATRRNRITNSIAHDPEATKNLLKMAKTFYDNLPEGLAPMKRYDNARSLVFENPDEEDKKARPGLGSEMAIATAKKKEARGGTIHNLHCSEVAFWVDASTLMIAALQQVPDHSDTMVILESTANGVGGYFYDMYWNAKNNKNDFEAIFLPWWIFPEYSRDVDVGFKITDDERGLKQLYNLTDEQISWRRWAIANKCEGSELKFKQEYPASDVEAFIVSGTPRFNQANLSLYKNNAKSARFIGELYSIDNPAEVKTPELIKSEKGCLQIFQWPNPDNKYVIGGDTAKGTVWSDNSCLQVLDCETGDQVAVWHGKADPTKFAYIAARLGYFYKGSQNAAFIGIEVNKDGITTNKILHSEIKYPNLYRRRTIDRTTEKNESKLGFHTNERSRELILNKLARWINEGEFTISHESTIMECMTFVYDPNGKAQAQEGSHDDCVMALAIAIYLFSYNPVSEKQKESEEKRLFKQGMKARGVSDW